MKLPWHWLSSDTSAIYTCGRFLIAGFAKQATACSNLAPKRRIRPCERRHFGFTVTTPNRPSSPSSLRSSSAMSDCDKTADISAFARLIHNRGQRTGGEQACLPDQAVPISPKGLVIPTKPCFSAGPREMTDDPETRQIRAFLDAGHPRLAFALIVVRRLLSEQRATRGRTLVLGGGLAGLVVLVTQLLHALGH